MALESGSLLGPYEILSPIGAGGMGDFISLPLPSNLKQESFFLPLGPKRSTNACYPELNKLVVFDRIET